MSELRWNPLAKEWTATATHRQDRTFFPPPDYCPLCPTREGGFPTEIPAENYDIVAFENRFPSLQPNPPEPVVQSSELYPVEKSFGVCEVVVYTPEHNSSLAQQPVEQIYKLVQVWRDRYDELSWRDFVKYVYIFENKGEAVGVTLNHPHGQIYAYPFVPPRIERQIENCREHFNRTGRNLIADILSRENDDGRRIVAQNESFTALIPFFARYPYELHIYPNHHAASLLDFDENGLRDLAEILKQVLSAFDKLFDISFPYIMAMIQEPSDGANYDFFDFHIEFYPPMRTATKLKFLAGSEAGAGMFINDTLPEDKAAELKSKIEPVIWNAAKVKN
ncbi:MAG: galactose-1-phosphate uridylyltransferase [Pyrinomonadaceae bacterium]|nr:galactose-1-phosphate uridylyltransferase [Pyrinomonadaceae bacterium]